MVFRHVRLALLLLISAAAIGAAEKPIPPAPTRWVTDTVGFMSPAAADALNSRLEAYERGTGHQFIVWIGDTTDGPPIEDWAVRAFEQWKVGRKGLDDGIALFVMAADRRLRIEVGYGLEGQVPDAIASRIINEIIVPRVQGGDPDGAVAAGMEALMQTVGGQTAVPATNRPANSPLTIGQLIVYGIIGILMLLFFITNPALAMYLLASIFAGGGRRGGGFGGGGFGGGGFGGGGGRSGGGGASGGW